MSGGSKPVPPSTPPPSPPPGGPTHPSPTGPASPGRCDSWLEEILDDPLTPARRDVPTHVAPTGGPVLPPTREVGAGPVLGSAAAVAPVAGESDRVGADPVAGAGAGGAAPVALPAPPFSLPEWVGPPEFPPPSIGRLYSA